MPDTDTDTINQSPENIGEQPAPGQAIATASPQVNPAVASQVNPASPAPTQAAPAVGALPTQTKAPQPTQQMPNPALANVAHHYSLGKLAAQLLGTQTQYQVGPDGKMVATPVKEAPGQFFRNMVAGAMLGGAASAASGSKTFGGGFAAGGHAVQEKGQQQDQIRRQQAQEDFKNQQDKQKADQERLLTESQIHHNFIQDAISVRNLQRSEQETIDKDNDSTSAMISGFDQAGATKPGIRVGGSDLNGQQGNGRALMNARTKDKSLQYADDPEHFHRVWTKNTDTTGLTKNEEGQWVDADKNVVDPEDRTTWTAYDVPNDYMLKDEPIKGSELKKLNPALTGVEPDRTYMINGNGRLAMHHDATQDNTSQAEAKFKLGQLRVEEQRVGLEATKQKVDLSKADRNDILSSRDAANEAIKTDEDLLKHYDSNPFLSNDQSTKNDIAEITQDMKKWRTYVSDAQARIDAFDKAAHPGAPLPAASTPTSTPTSTPATVQTSPGITPTVSQAPIVDAHALAAKLSETGVPEVTAARQQFLNVEKQIPQLSTPNPVRTLNPETNKNGNWLIYNTPSGTKYVDPAKQQEFLKPYQVQYNTARDAFVSAAQKNGLAPGVPLPKPPQPGAPIPLAVAQQYLAANRGNKDAANSAAQQAGWATK